MKIGGLEYDILGFNRYMVECEFYSYEGSGRQVYVLIDTWWNVNSFILCIYITPERF